MPSAENWRPSRAVFKGGRWRASRDTRYVSVSSRMMADLQIAAYARYIARCARGRVADIGCGLAPYFGMYKQQADEVVCVDWPGSPHDARFVDVTCDLNKELLLESNSIDTLICTDVLEHIYKPSILWSEIARVLKPGGNAVIGVPFLYWVHEEPHDHHRYTEFALAAYAAEAGLRLDELEVIGGPYVVAGDVLGKVLKPIPLACAIIHAVSGGLNKATSDRARRKFPAAYVLAVSKPADAAVVEGESTSR